MAYAEKTDQKLAAAKAPGPLQADVKKQKNDLAGYLTARANVSTYVQGIQNASLPDINFKKLPKDLQDKLPADPNALLAEVKKNLDTAKANALNWSNNIEPNLTDIPQALINFNAKFKSSASSISGWLAELANGNDTNKPVLLQTLTWLIGQIDAQTAMINTEMDLIKKFNTQLTEDHENFSTSNNGFSVLYDFEKKSIKTMTDAIKGLQDAIDAENTAITAAGIAAGVGGGLMIAGGIGLAAAETGVGAVVAVVVIVAGLVAAIAGIVELVKAINAKVDTENQINADQMALSLLSVQATSLLQVEKALSNLVDLSTKALAAVQVILDTWGTLKSKIVAVHDDLAAAKGKDLGKITAVFDVNAAVTQWADLETFAGHMQTYVQRNFQKTSKLGALTPLVVGKNKAA